MLGFANVNDKPGLISPWYKNGTLAEYLRDHPEINRASVVGIIVKLYHTWLMCARTQDPSCWGRAVLFAYSGTAHRAQQCAAGTQNVMEATSPTID